MIVFFRMGDTPNELTLLGDSTTRPPSSPDCAILEIFPNPKPDREFWIRLTFNDFSSLCPVTGQPDAASLSIAYVPRDKCVETKSLKFYLQSFRNFEGFNETIINRIADDLVAACDPVKAEIRGEFVPRGGIQLTVEIAHPPDS